MTFLQAIIPGERQISLHGLRKDQCLSLSIDSRLISHIRRGLPAQSLSTSLFESVSAHVTSLDCRVTSHDGHCPPTPSVLLSTFHVYLDQPVQISLEKHQVTAMIPIGEIAAYGYGIALGLRAGPNDDHYLTVFAIGPSLAILCTSFSVKLLISSPIYHAPLPWARIQLAKAE